MKVVTTKGTLVKDQMYAGQDARPMTEDEAKSLAAKCNAEAEKLGIEARYEVKA